MMTLYQSQENVSKAIKVGVEAKQVFEKMGGNSAIETVANISHQLLFFIFLFSTRLLFFFFSFLFENG
jgi:hypothetical protein